MALKSFSYELVTVSLSIILPCLAISAILELGLKNGAPKRPENWNDRFKRAVNDVWWPKNMFSNDAGLLNASAALALILPLVLGPVAFYALRKGPLGVSPVASRLLSYR